MRGVLFVVGGRGLEPPCLTALLPKSSVSTISPPARFIYHSIYRFRLAHLNVAPDSFSRRRSKKFHSALGCNVWATFFRLVYSSKKSSPGFGVELRILHRQAGTRLLG